MHLLAAWVLFPALVAVAATGVGLLLDRASGRALPGVLIPVGGFAAIQVLVSVFTWRTPWLALPGTVVVAATGFVVGRSRVRLRQVDRWAATAGVLVLLLFGAPTYLTGTPTFSGSLVLPDTSNQLALAVQLAEHGRDYASLPESSFKTTVTKYLVTQYPVAAQATLGVLSPLGAGEQIAWLYQPFLAFTMAMACLAFFALLAPLIRSRMYRAIASFFVAQPALIYSYALQGSIKEITGVTMVAAVFATCVVAAKRPGPRALIPPLVCCGAVFGALGPAGVVYVAIPVLFAFAAWIKGLSRPVFGRRHLAISLGALVALGGAVVALLPSIRTAYNVNNITLSMARDLGNLADPLEVRQAAGVWLGGDFRYSQEYPGLGLALAIGVGVAAVFGLVWIARRRIVGVGLPVAALLLVSAFLLQRGSPYADGKVLVLVSPAVALAAIAGLAWLAHARGRLVLLAAVPLGLGILGSNALAYHEVQRAPYERYQELSKINTRFDGDGPLLLTEYDEYAGYLLRDVGVRAEPESILDYRGRPLRKPSGLTDRRYRPSVKSALDIDDLSTGYVQSMRLLAIRRSPNTSRPPANFDRVFRGTYYDVWKRRPSARVVAHLPLGASAFAPSGVPRCSAVRALARRARRDGGRLAYVARPTTVGTNAIGDGSDVPNAWFRYGAYPRAIVPRGPGRLRRTVDLPVGGRYRLWIEGSISRRVRVLVDGRLVGGVAYEAGNPGQYFPLGGLNLRPGRHRITVERGGGDLRPGNGGQWKSSLQHLGPVVLSPPANERKSVQTVAPEDAGQLCGRRLDWIEIVRD